MDPRYHTTLASLGQRYQDYPAATFDQRFGPYDARPDQQMMQELFMREMQRQRDEQLLRSTPGAIIPGQQLVDPYQRGIGERHPSGYYTTRGI